MLKRQPVFILVFCFIDLLNPVRPVRDNYGLFTWREGAPANRATRLEGLKHSGPLHVTRL